MDYNHNFTFDELFSVFKIQTWILTGFINDTSRARNCKGLVFHPGFYTTEVFLLVDVAIHVKRQTARTSLKSFFSVCFLLFDAA